MSLEPDEMEEKRLVRVCSAPTIVKTKEGLERPGTRCTRTSPLWGVPPSMQYSVAPGPPRSGPPPSYPEPVYIYDSRRRTFHPYYPPNTAHSHAYRHQDDWETDSTDYIFTKRIRKQFIFKVYLILTAQLAFTIALSLLAVLTPPIRSWCRNYWYLGIVFSLLFASIYICLACYSSIRRSYPLNVVLLCFMTLFMSLSIMFVVAAANVVVFMYAVGVTACVTLVVTLFAKFSPWDVTGCGMVCLVLSFVLLFLSLACTIVFFVHGPVPVLHLVLSIVSAIIFTLFLLFDTQMILGGRRIELSPEEYILGAIQLYLDIVMIFLNILGIMSFDH